MTFLPPTSPAPNVLPAPIYDLPAMRATNTADTSTVYLKIDH